MACNDYVGSTSNASDELLSAGIVVAWITAGAFALCIFDVGIYWAYFSGSVDALNLPRRLHPPQISWPPTLFEFVIRDAVRGETTEDTQRTQRKAGVRDAAVGISGDQLEEKAASAVREKEEPLTVQGD
ncbi:hypothetical protein C8R44DRAFT_890439 [Mycena epipterygia]|nr:hypothetical protein C8R44DRAFT_890439 [Mycena epipterygia]